MKRPLISLILVLLVGMNMAYAEDNYDFAAVCSTGQTLYYKITDDDAHTVELTHPHFIGDYYGDVWDGYPMPTGDIVLPSEVEHDGVLYSVTSIGESAFESCSGLTGSLTIPNSVTTIGDYAFAECSGLTGSLTIPNSVTSIGEGAFVYCSGLSGSLTIPNSVTTIGESAFEYCSGLSGSLTIPNSVTTIGEWAFDECDGISGSLTIGNSLAVLSPGCFAFNNFSSISVDSNNPFYYSEGNAVISRSDKMLVLGCKNTSIPNDVNAIGDYAFAYCSGLSGSLTIPNSVTTIGESAFEYCSGLSGSLTIPNSVTTIGSWAFYYCDGLTGSLTLGNSLAVLNMACFVGTDFSSISVDSNNPYYYSEGNALISRSDKILVLGCKNTSIPNDVNAIGDYAFGLCSSLSGPLIIPNSVTTIGDYAFFFCSSLTGSLTIPSSVTSIGDYAFAYCSGLLSLVSKAETPPYIGDECFIDVPEDIPVQVPCGCVDAYRQADGWSSFNIVETQFFVAISSSDAVCGSVSFVLLPNCDNSQVTVLATENTENGSFLNWSENGVVVSADASYSFIAVADRNLVANFKSLQYDFAAVCSTGQTLYYKITDDDAHTVELTHPHFVGDDYGDFWEGYSKPSGNIVLPSEVEHDGILYTVTSIGDYAFYECNGLTGSLTIPNSVTSIGEGAFAYCSGLSGSLTLGNSLAVLNMACFAGTDFSSISVDSNNPFYYSEGNAIIGRSDKMLVLGCKNTSIPNDVNAIGDYAFYECNGLTGSLTIPNSVTTIGDYAFAECSGLTGSLTIPNSVTTIGSWAFYYCDGLTGSLIIGNSVISIGEEAFNGCSGLTGSLTIGNSVTSIDNWAFSNCVGISSLVSKAKTPPYIGDWCFYNVPENIPVQVPCGCVDAYRQADGWSSFSNFVEAPFFDFAAVCSTGQTLYYKITDDDAHTVELTHPHFVDDDPSDSWEGYSMPSGPIILPSEVEHDGILYTVTSIGDYAFFFCSSLSGSLTIPNSVTSIGVGAFAYCSGLSGSLTLGNSLAVLNMGCFAGTDFSSISVDSNNPFYYSEGNALISRSDKILVIGCKNTSIPNDVNAIGDYAFAGCSGLTGSLTIPSSVTSIGEGAFGLCSGLSGSLIIPNSVTSIGNMAFVQCTGITGSLTIPNSVTSIGYSAFENCSGFTGSLTIGSSVTSIGDRAFCWCENLESINVKLLTPLPIEEDVFCGIDKSIPVYVPFGTIDAYTSAEGWREFTNFNDQAVFYSIAVSASPIEGGGVLGCYDDQFFVGSSGVDTESLMGSLEVTYGTSGSAEVMGGSRIVLIARANTGWDFVGWKENDEIVSYESVFSFIITDDRNIEAVFEQCTNCLEPELLSGRFSVSGCTAISFARSNTFMSVDPLTLYGAIEGVTEFDEEMSEQMMAQFLQTGLTLPMAAGLLFGGIELPGINYVIGEHQWDRMTYDASTLNGNNSAYNELLLTGVDVFPSFILRGNIDCWHIPTWREWDYLINQRVTESGIRFAYGTVNEVCGLILLPDDWQVSTFALTHANEIGNYDNNVITASTWTEVLEPAGAVFLPANGFMTQGTLTQSLPDGQPVGAYPGLLISPNEELAGIPMTGSSSLYVDELIMLGYILDLSNGGTSLRLAKVTDTSTATITLASNDSEQGSVAGAGEFACQQNCTITAVANEGYVFMYWLENGEAVSNDPTYSFQLLCDRNFTAVFAPEVDVCQLNLEVTSMNSAEMLLFGMEVSVTIDDKTFILPSGSVPDYLDLLSLAQMMTMTGNEEVVTYTINVPRESNVTIDLFIPDFVNNLMSAAGGSIENLVTYSVSYVDGGFVVENSSEFPFEFTSNCYNMVSAVPNNTEYGAINDETSFEREFYYGESCTLTASANEGYAFVSWTEDGETVSLESEYTFTVTNNRNLIANFIPTHTISYIVDPSESGFVTNTTPFVINFGFEDGVIPGGWNNDVSAYPWTIWNSNPHEGGYCLASNNYNRNNSESFVEFTVEYATNGSIDFFSRISSESVSYDYGIFYIDGVEQYREGGTGNTWTNRHFEVAAGPHVFRWFYRKDNIVSSGEDRYFIDDITLQGVGHGDVFTLGETCTLTATPATGYHFVNWTENSEEITTESNYSFVVTGDRDLVANFALNYYDIVAVADSEEGGVVTGGGNYGHGSECTLTAIPNEGYVFVSWQEDGEVVSEDTSYTFEVVGERHLVAVFALKYTISAAAVPTEGGMIDIFEELTVCDDLSTNEYVPFYGLYADAFLKTEFIIPAEQLVMMDGRRVTRMKFYASTANASFVNANFKVFLKEVDDTTIDAFTGYDDAIVVYQGAISVTDNTMTIPFCAPYTYHGGNLLVGFYNESQGFCVGCYFYGQNASGASVQGHSYNSLNAVEPTQCDFLPKTTFTYDKELVYLVGSLCSMTAIPYPGYAFSQWTENGMTVSTDPTYSFVVESNRTLEAHFTDHHEMELNTGWNWVSSFVDLSDSGLSMVEDALGGNGQIIKSQRDGFVMRSNGNWYGNLTGLQNQYMYRLQTSAPVNMALYAPVLNPSEVTVSLLNGWNWIGYPLSYGLNVNSALVNLNPTENDMLKSNGHFAVFDGTEWFGALQTMSPGEGYMYYASQPQSFTYATDGFTMRSVELEPKHYWQTNVHVCPDNMTVMAVVAVNGTELRESAMELGAFCQGRNVGSVRLRYNASRDRYYAPLLVSANEGDVVVFKLYDVESGCEFIGEAEEMLNFSADAMNGSLDDPMVLHFGLTNSVAEENAQMLEAYPNPVNKGGEIWLNLSDSDCPADVEIYDMLGVMVDKRQLTSNHFVLSDNLAPAAYFIKIYTSDGHLHSGKLIVK